MNAFSLKFNGLSAECPQAVVEFLCEIVFSWLSLHIFNQTLCAIRV